MSLGDISIFTNAEDVPLSQVFDNISKKFDNQALDVKAYSTPQQYHELMDAVLADWDQERVHNSDIKKIISWYNILVGAGITDFTTKEEEAQEPTEENND